MAKMKVVNAVKNDLRTDVTWNKVGYLATRGARAFPSAAKQYLLDKAPIVGWLPRYSPRWVLNDVIAGLTVGLMLIPQGLSYATLATIPVQYGLMSAWFPGVLYAVMGTTKGKKERDIKSSQENLASAPKDGWTKACHPIDAAV